MPVLDLNDITLRRGEAHLLRGISWRIEHGEHWALLGANGSGKTTLLKIVTGYEFPTTGSAAVLGERLGETDVRDLRRRIGWASSALVTRFGKQDTPRNIVLSGIDASIGLWREFAQAEEEAADHALERTGAGGLGTKPWEVLSQGERQRVLIARAIVNNPPLLILDEPCAGLDPAAREDFLDDVEEMMRRPAGPTVILVTHHVEEIRDAFTHTLAIREGAVVASGPTPQVVTSEIVSATYERKVEAVKAERGYRLIF